MMVRKSVVFTLIVCLVLFALVFTGLASKGPWVNKWLGTYRMQHGGWKGTLVVSLPKVATYGGPNLDIKYIGDDGKSYTGYGYVQGPNYQSGPELIDPLNFTIDNAAAAIGIRFYIDFASTPEVGQDDTMFVGYLMGGDRMAGYHKNQRYYRTFGWYAVKKGAPGSSW